MIRLALRQFRAEAFAGFGLLAVLAVALAVTGPHLAQVNDAFQRACRVEQDCATAPNPVAEVDPLLQSLLLPFVVTVAPALVGIFFGAPLVARELEAGTFRLAWTQSVTWRRWLAVKLGLVGLAALAIGGLLTWMVSWWSSPLDAVNKNHFDPGPFGWHGVVPIGYAAFAFALGTSAGVWLRRTVPAMAATLAGFVAARLVVQQWVRPHLASPLHKSFSLASLGRFGTLSLSSGRYSLTPPPVSIPNGWVLSTAVAEKSGHPLTSGALLRACPAFGRPPNPATIQSIHSTCLAKLSAAFRTVVTYQPASRFWPFQWAEMGIFLAAALALCGLTFWWLRRRYG